jgi:hypothetical protein
VQKQSAAMLESFMSATSVKTGFRARARKYDRMFKN